MRHQQGATQGGIDELLACATRVRERAYVPYSNFPVGAAVATDDGSVHGGCNVENVAYPEGTCAEAGAIAAMVAAGGSKEIVAVAIIADSPEPVAPCGGCRQKLAEFSASDTSVILATTDGKRVQTSVGALLPGAFGRNHMSRA